MPTIVNIILSYIIPLLVHINNVSAFFVNFCNDIFAKNFVFS
jgi:hypothetical protein